MLASALTTAIMIGATGVASAWTYKLTGQGVCQPDGSFKVTWKVNNSTENEPLTVTYSSNNLIIPVGSTVPAHQSKDFIRVGNGKVAATFSLTLKANWPSDQANHTQHAEVKLTKACPQPVQTPVQPPVTPPTDGGRGAGTPVATTPTVTTPQVVVPQGSVNAGVGINSQTGAYVGLGASGLVLAEGIRRLTKQLLARR